MTSSEPVITLRPVVAEDRAFLERVYASSREEELRPLDWNEEQKQAFLLSQFEAQDQYYHEHFPDCAYQVVLCGDEPIGRLYLDRREDEHRIVDIALLPEFRGKGIGHGLMRRILDEARAQGLPVRIHVEQFNPALKLYKRLGFKHLGEVGVYFFMEWDPEENPA